MHIFHNWSDWSEPIAERRTEVVNGIKVLCKVTHERKVQTKQCFDCKMIKTQVSSKERIIDEEVIGTWERQPNPDYWRIG